MGAMKYDQRYDHDQGAASGVQEALEPYLSSAEPGPHRKLSISLPADLLAALRDVAEATGTPLSGVIAAALRRLVDDVAQVRLDRALRLDADENVAWAEAGAGVHARLVGDLEW
jgi:hypothetical protein